MNFNNIEEIIEFYSNLKSWDFYISGGDCNKGNLVLVEITDKILTYNNENYLPSPVSMPNSAYTKRIQIELGYQWVWLIKKGTKNGLVNVWHPYIKVDKNPSISVLKALNANTNEIYVYPYQGHIRVDYNQSGRSGLKIENIYCQSLWFWFVETYLSQRWDWQKQIIFPTNDFLIYITNLETEINEILNSSMYDIEYDESYGDYTLRYLKMELNCFQKIDKLIKEKLNSYETYLKNKENDNNQN